MYAVGTYFAAARLWYRLIGCTLINPAERKLATRPGRHAPDEIIYRVKIRGKWRKYSGYLPEHRAVLIYIMRL